MSDWTRDRDLQQIAEARQGAKSQKEAERYDRLSHQIKEQARDSRLSSARQELAGAMRTGADSRVIKGMNEKIREMSLRKGLTKK